MKLYYAKGTCSLTVRILINYLDIECEFTEVNLKTHITAEGEDFYKISPKGAVGTLALDKGCIITENTVIMQYLIENVAEDNALLPASGLDRYRVLEWLNYIATELHKGTGPLNTKIPEEIKEEVFRPQLNKKLDYLNKILSQNFYLTGDALCLADFYLYVVLRWLPHLGIKRDSFECIENFFQRLHVLPAVQKSLQQEGLN